jgi:hypothetical protein
MGVGSFVRLSSVSLCALLDDIALGILTLSA